MQWIIKHLLLSHHRPGLPIPITNITKYGVLQRLWTHRVGNILGEATEEDIGLYIDIGMYLIINIFTFINSLTQD